MGAEISLDLDMVAVFECDPNIAMSSCRRQAADVAGLFGYDVSGDMKGLAVERRVVDMDDW